MQVEQRTTRQLLRIASLMVATSLVLAPTAYAKHASMKLPAVDALMDGAGPDSKESQQAAHSSNDLSPMKLTDESESYSADGEGKMKATVTKSEEVQGEGATASKDPASGESESVVGGKDSKLADKLLKDGKKVNVVPLALIESDDEAQRKLDTTEHAEKGQLTDLWQATISRNPDIQFVINRLQPNTDPNHATASAVKMLSGALFNAIQAVPFMLGPSVNPAVYMGTGAGMSAIGELLGKQNDKAARKQQISQEQATILYKIIRDVADKLVAEYRNYKKEMNIYSRATSEFQDLQSMVAEARSGQGPAAQIEMAYTLNKAQREIDGIGENIRLHRQHLVDLAGGEAVDKLDGQITEERLALQKLTGTNVAQQQEAQPQQPVFTVPIPTADNPNKIAPTAQPIMARPLKAEPISTATKQSEVGEKHPL